MTSTLRALGFGAAATIVVLAACSDEQDPQLTAAQLTAAQLTAAQLTAAQLTTAQLTTAQAELLDLGFRAASALPELPHAKARSRAQQSVVEASLELDQPDRALGCLAAIGDWRQGLCLALVAEYRVAHGVDVDVDDLLDRAESIALAIVDDPNSQSWRISRVLARVAGVRAMLGESEQARTLEAGLLPAEAGQVATMRAAVLAADEFDQLMAELDRVLGSGDSDQMRHALETCARLYSRFYDNELRRDRLADRVLTAAASLPVQVRLDSLLAMADEALRHGDLVAARRWSDAAQESMDATEWQPRHLIPNRARVAERRFRTGDEVRAREDLDSALTLFRSSRDQITDIFRATALLPLAEAFQTIEQTDRAAEVYRLAIADAVVNPNSRPRAVDLVSICCSMATHGFDPDAGVRRRLIELVDALSDPW